MMAQLSRIFIAVEKTRMNVLLNFAFYCWEKEKVSQREKGINSELSEFCMKIFCNPNKKIIWENFIFS